MSTAFSLSLPLDIPWKRICVTKDMLDPVVCDSRFPPKWQSSIAVFKYTPVDDYQLYPDYEISYLKVTVTLTGYQPLDQEIQGSIDWDGVNVETIEGLTELLNSYNPCHGAIIQVVVGPHRVDRENIERYPFFLDFEPKKRELYEMATDTKERQSRSIETLNITKSAGTAQSQEVFDVDMGGSTSFGLQASYAGTGGGFNYGSSSSGQWGTKSLNTQESMASRSSDFGQEKRETHSHTTQISQMYHQLDGYHLGTNRAVFFVQPRPHVIEEPSGFVRGPRPVEGMQEFFMVVAAPKDRREYCVSVRVDTSHLTETDILEYDDKTDVSELANAVARVPTRNDIPDGTTTREACFIACWDVTYLCFRTHAVDDQVYTAPTGYVITGYDTIVNDTHHGSTSVSIAPGGKTLTVHAEAGGHICFEDSGVCVDCPDEVDKWSGYARRQVQVRLRSEEPIKKVGTRQSLLITTRGLCCCPDQVLRPERVKVRPGADIPDYLGGSLKWSAVRGAGTTAGKVVGSRGSYLPAAGETATLAVAQAAAGGAEEDCGSGGKGGGLAAAYGERAERRLSIRQANGIGEFIHRELIKSLSDPHPERQPRYFEDSDIFTRQLGRTLRRTSRGRNVMSTPLSKAGDDGPSRRLISALSKLLKKPAASVTVSDLVAVSNYQLERHSGVPLSDVARFKSSVLGAAMKKQEPKPKEPPQGTKGERGTKK